MKAMLLAAGRGSRMGRLTDKQPKPLLKVGSKTLITHQLDRLTKAGYGEIIVNTSYLGAAIRDHLLDHPAEVRFSTERKRLETAGGIIKMLPFLGTKFLVINSDVWCEHELRPPKMKNMLAHLVMVDNPEHHPRGDFALDRQQRLRASAGTRLTYSGIGWFRSGFFKQTAPGRRPLAPLLHRAIKKGRVSGEHFQGHWTDVGTPERLLQVNKLVKTR